MPVVAVDRQGSASPRSGNSQSSPANDICAVVTNDAGNDNCLDVGGTAVVANSFEVGVSGDVALVTAAGRAIIVPAANLPAGKVFPCRVRRFVTTGTTATGIIAYLGTV